MVGWSEAIAGPRPPRNRACAFQRTRLGLLKGPLVGPAVIVHLPATTSRYWLGATAWTLVSPSMYPVVGFVLPSVPSPCERISRLRVLWTDLTPHVSSASLLVVSAWLTCLSGRGLDPCTGQERVRPPKSLDASLHTSHALRGPRPTLGALTLSRSLCELLFR